ncbi:MAG: hypothetical protein ACTSUD_09410 [Alphaproteobacteria bacterium]
MVASGLALLVWLAIGIQAEAASGAKARTVSPSDAVARRMVKITLVTFNNAVRTGNFTVLRLVTAKRFRARFSAAKLRRRFATFRKRRVDLSPIVSLGVIWDQRPVVDRKGGLRLRGYFATLPRIVRFDFRYRMEGGAWMLTHIAIHTNDSPAK